MLTYRSRCCATQSRLPHIRSAGRGAHSIALYSSNAAADGKGCSRADDGSFADSRVRDADRTAVERSTAAFPHGGNNERIHKDRTS